MPAVSLSESVLWSLHLLQQCVSSECAVLWPACVHFFLLIQKLELEWVAGQI